MWLIAIRRGKVGRASPFSIRERCDLVTSSGKPADNSSTASRESRRVSRRFLRYAPNAALPWVSSMCSNGFPPLGPGHVTALLDYGYTPRIPFQQPVFLSGLLIRNTLGPASPPPPRLGKPDRRIEAERTVGPGRPRLRGARATGPGQPPEGSRRVEERAHVKPRFRDRRRARKRAELGRVVEDEEAAGSKERQPGV